MGYFIEPFIEGDYSFLFNINTPSEILAGSLFVLLLSSVVICIVVNNNYYRIRYIALITLCLYIFFLVCHTIIFREPRREMQFEVVPFWSYIDIIKDCKIVFLFENILNIILFIPVGFLLGSIIGKKRWKKLLILGASISILIEITQLITHRGLCEFDDVFHNTLGCCFGYLLFYLLSIIFVKLRKFLLWG